MSLSDRILVMYEGEIVGQLDPKKTTVSELGLYRPPPWPTRQPWRHSAPAGPGSAVPIPSYMNIGFLPGRCHLLIVWVILKKTTFWL